MHILLVDIKMVKLNLDCCQFFDKITNVTKIVSFGENLGFECQFHIFFFLQIP